MDGLRYSYAKKINNFYGESAVNITDGQLLYIISLEEYIQEEKEKAREEEEEKQATKGKKKIGSFVEGKRYKCK